MMETLTGRDFLDLGKLEQVLCAYEGVETAQAYITWGQEHRMELCADITGKEQPDLDKLNAYLQEKVEPVLVPKQIHFTQTVS